MRQQTTAYLERGPERDAPLISWRSSPSTIGPFIDARLRSIVAVGFFLVTTNCTSRHLNGSVRGPAVPSIEICGNQYPVDAQWIDCYDPPSAAGYQLLTEFQNLRTVRLQDIEMTAGAVKALESLPRLEELILATDDLTDESLGQFVGISQLKRLHVPHSKLSDSGVEALAQIFPNLEELGLCFTSSVTNDGLLYLRHLRKLKTLLLCGEGFTSDALEILSTLHGLTLIDLASTAIDRDAARRFARQRPGVTILLGGVMERHRPNVLD